MMARKPLTSQNRNTLMILRLLRDGKPHMWIEIAMKLGYTNLKHPHLKRDIAHHVSRLRYRLRFTRYTVSRSRVSIPGCPQSGTYTLIQSTEVHYHVSTKPGYDAVRGTKT